MSNKPIWVELQPMVTLTFNAAADVITQPIEHYLDADGYNVADFKVEVFNSSSSGVGTGHDVSIETGPSRAAPPLFEDVSSGNPTVFEVAAQVADAQSKTVNSAYTDWDREANNRPPIQRFVRWSVKALEAQSVITFRIQGILREQ